MTQRTSQQNRALYKYFELLADELNSAGFDMKKTLKPEIEIPWNKEMVKTHIWKPVQQAITGGSSTTDMDTVEPSKIYEVINRYTAEKFGISVQWPSGVK